MDMCHFAFTTYAKTLTELRNYVRGLPFDEDPFLVKMQTLDDTITDFAPPVPDVYTQKYRARFKHMPVAGDSVDLRTPAQLLEKKQAYKKP